MWDSTKTVFTRKRTALNVRIRGKKKRQPTTVT